MDRSRLLQQVLLHQGQQAIIDAHAAFLVVRRRRRRQKQCRSVWVCRWLSAVRRLQYGQYGRLMAELRMEDVHSFFNFLWMQPEMFDELLNRVGPRIQKNDTLWRKSVDPGLKLAITLGHLAAGGKYPTLQFGFRVAQNNFDFYGAFTIGVACQQGTLTLPDTWFRPPLWDLLVLQLLRPRTCHVFTPTFHLEYPLVLSRFALFQSCARQLLRNIRMKLLLALHQKNVGI